MTDPNLVTTCNFNGQEYLFKMNVVSSNLEILVTDKNSGEEWQCSYDATYIENLTHKTGNFKQFDIFVTMIKSGLLRTSECVTLDLLTFEDLELLRSRKITKACGTNNSNRRYLIVTYCVEFDKIRYPLPLEYCGPPDPVVLQSTIRRLELELARTKEELNLKAHQADTKTVHLLQQQIEELTLENLELQEDIRHLTKLLETKPKTQIASLQKAMDKLERSVVNERNSHHELVEKLRNDKMLLAKELEKLKWSERNLRMKLKNTQVPPTRACHGDCGVKGAQRKRSESSLNTVFRRARSPVLNMPKHTDDRVEFLRTPQTPKKTEPWHSPTHCVRYSRIDQKLQHKVRSRSSSSNSIKCAREQPMAALNTPSPRSREASPGNHSRSSSVSKCSSKCSQKCIQAKYKKSEMDFKRLEDKIESLQKLLKMNLK